MQSQGKYFRLPDCVLARAAFLFTGRRPFATFCVFFMKQPAHIKELFSYRLNHLAFLSSAIAESLNKERYGLDKQDWRFLALLAAFQPMSLKSLAKEANIDKSRASRSIASLERRGLITRRADDRDGRGIQLSLSPEGEALYAEVFPLALSRNEDLLDALSPAEKEQINFMLDKLLYRARVMFGSLHGGKKR